MSKQFPLPMLVTALERSSRRSHSVITKAPVYGFAIGDLDGDGLQDIAVARSDAPNVVYFGVRL
jgi:hypothetical protein